MLSLLESSPSAAAASTNPLPCSLLLRPISSALEFSVSRAFVFDAPLAISRPPDPETCGQAMLVREKMAQPPMTAE